MIPSPIKNIYINPGLGESYFDRLVKRSDHWKSWSMRDPKLVAGKKYFTYDPVNDKHPQKQDATKIIVPAFYPTNSLLVPINETETTIVPSDKRNTIWPTGRIIKLDSEIMTVAGKVLVDGKLAAVKVNRAQFNTIASAHGTTIISHSTNSVQSDLNLPINTTSGHSYFFTFDSFWCNDYINCGQFNHKAFHFLSGGPDSNGALFWELQASYGKVTSGIASHQVRGYNSLGGDVDYSKTDGNRLGPGIKNKEPIEPRIPYIIKAGIWTRFFLHVNQKDNDYDIMNMWVADELTAPIKTLNNVPASIRRGSKLPEGIASFKWEMNSSNDYLMRSDLRDLNSYVRNFVALIDPVSLPIEQPRKGRM